MKIKIITIHDIGINFGSTLQACALYDFIKNNFNHNIEIINYKPKYAYNHGKIGQIIKKILFFKYVIKQQKRFKEYYKAHACMTKRYNNYNNLKNENDGDLFIVGSDQVWNDYYNAGRDDAYYLKFTDCVNKISYSSSLGQIQSKESIQKLKEKIKNFKYISVREKPSAVQLESVGLKVSHVLDPVFLHEKEYYIDNEFVNKYGDYLLIYAVDTDSLMDEVATRIAKKMNLKIVLVGGYIQKYNYDYYLRDIGPKEFTNLINNAKFVVANSFHATAFSIIFNKQFCLVSPKVSPLRLIDMLDTASIEDRIVHNMKEIDKIYRVIDYTIVNKVIENKKNESKKYLIESINDLLK